MRDFVHVSDIVQACQLAMASRRADYQVFNVGTGRPIERAAGGGAARAELGWSGGFDVVRKFRAGDIRHCFADIARIRSARLRAALPFEDGVRELVDWVRAQQADQASSVDADHHLAAYGLVR